MKHPLPASFVETEIKVALVGCGGNGSQMLTGLARMHIALKSLGHPGFAVTVFDPDRVSEANIGRQLFSYADVGHYKCNILVHRLNVFFGLDWKALPTAFPNDRTGEHRWNRPQLVIGCVDSARSRRGIHAWSRQFFWDSPLEDKADNPYWLDVGNLSRSGQVVLGQFNPVFRPTARVPSSTAALGAVDHGGRHAKVAGRLNSTVWKEWARNIYPLHLPNVTDLFPSILDTAVPEVDIPSCSLAQALESQDLFVNQTVTTFALQLLWMFFREGGLDHHGYFINLQTGSVRPLPIDREVWRRFNPAIVGEAPVKPLERKKKTSPVQRKKKIHSHA